VDPTLGVVLAAVCGGLLSYLAAARRLSGKVSTSEATDLWAESRSIREWSAGRIAELTEEIRTLEKRIENVEGHNEELLTDKRQLQGRVEELMRELTECRRACESLHNKLHDVEGGLGAEGSPEGS
jgi:chromosome segregation ATPase